MESWEFTGRKFAQTSEFDVKANAILMIANIKCLQLYALVQLW